MCLRDYGYYAWRPYGPHFYFRIVEYIIVFVFLIIVCCTLKWFPVNIIYKSIVFAITVAALIICLIDLFTRCFKWAIPWMAWLQIGLVFSLGFFLISGLGLTQLVQCLPAYYCIWIRAITIIAALIALLFLIEIFFMIYWLAFSRGWVIDDYGKKGGGYWFGNKAPCADSTGRPYCGDCYIAPCADEFGVAPCGVCSKPTQHGKKTKGNKGFSCTCGAAARAAERESRPAAAPKPLLSKIMLCYCTENEGGETPHSPHIHQQTGEQEKAPTPSPPHSTPALARSKSDINTPKYVTVPGSYGGTFPCEKYGAPLPSPCRERKRYETQKGGDECVCSPPPLCGGAPPYKPPKPPKPCGGTGKCGAAYAVAHHKKTEEDSKRTRRMEFPCSCVPAPAPAPCPDDPCPFLKWPADCSESHRQRGGSSALCSARTEPELARIRLPGAADRSPSLERKSME